MADKQRYITRTGGDDLYTELQRKTLDELQRLSGEVWTDYNPGDPGVTIADAVDYALTETDYKFSFPLEDYLAGENDVWTEEVFGLFPSKEVYPSAPVTADDYRRLVLVNFPMIEEVKVETVTSLRIYDFKLRLSSFFTDNYTIRERVGKFLNRYRNLCEQIGEISIEQTEALFFHADFRIEPGQDATDILVQIYWTAMHYISGSVEIRRPESEDMLPMRADEWYDGPVAEVRADIPEQRCTESELYWKLRQIPGIESFKTCCFKDKDNKVITDFSAGYSLQIPETLKDVTVRIGEEQADTDMPEFRERLRAKYFMRSTFRLRSFMQEQESITGKSGVEKCDENKHEASAGTAYHATYRNVYGHTPLASDLPSCYEISERDFMRNTPAKDRAGIRNFGNYLRLFDLILLRGMKELDSLKELFSIKDMGKELSRAETLPADTVAMRKENDRYRPVAALRNRYMDFLDSLYGVDSNPLWLREFEYYGQTEDDTLRRRMRFLCELPRLIRNRFVSFDMTGGYGGENIPAVKKYLSLLLDFNGEEESSVGNILPGHNLILMGNGEKGRYLRGLMNSRMIDDEVFAADAVEAIGEDQPPRTKQEKLERDEDLRRNLPIFNSNWISGSLFREGIVLSNYNLVRLNNREWLLVFRGKEEDSRMNLGRSDDKHRLGRWANTLCRYLRELNRQCETVYVVEKNLFGREGADTVMLVFTGWTARTRSLRFREACIRLARSLIPAHLKMETYWLDAMQMQYFEECHRRWRESLQKNTPEEMCAMFRSRMMRILENDFVSRGESAERQRGYNGEENSNKENV